MPLCLCRMCGHGSLFEHADVDVCVCVCECIHVCLWVGKKRKCFFLAIPLIMHSDEKRPVFREGAVCLLLFNLHNLGFVPVHMIICMKL